MKTVVLPSSEHVPAFGMGTWRMGESTVARAEEIATLRLGLDFGATLIDTAEMYGEGIAEELIGEAIAGRRDEIFLVSKMYPHNATLKGAVAACERSLQRLRTDRLDLYLLHWRGDVPLAQSIEAFVRLRDAGKIRYFGVSNFDVADMRELASIPDGDEFAANQVLYNLVRRGIEWDLLPWLRERRIPMMAYSPLEQGELARDPKLVRFAKRYGITPAQAALAWLLSRDNVIVIPKSSRRARLKENIAALEMKFTPAQLQELDVLFPPPNGRRALEMI